MRDFMGNTTMLSCSANRSSPIYRTEYCSCAVLLMRDRHTQPVHLPYDVKKPLVTQSLWGEVSSADKLSLVMESVKRDVEHGPGSRVPIPAERAGGSKM